VTLLDDSGREVDGVVARRPLTVRLSLRASRLVRRPIVEIGIADGRIGALAKASMLLDGATPDSVEGEFTVDCTFDDLPLMPRVYELWAGVRGEAGFGDLLGWQRVRLFRIEGDVTEAGLAAVSESLTKAPIQLSYKWKVGSARDRDP